MKKDKRARLKADGWRVGSATDFLGLSPEEEALVEIHFALSGHLRECRRKKRLSQQALADLMNSSQSRVAKMEADDASVSIELLLRSLLALGATRKEIGRVIGREVSSA